MKLALYGDIHAQLTPLEVILAEVDKHNVDWEVVLGDHVMGGPEPGEVIDALRARKNSLPILGNFDRWVIDKIDEQDNPFPGRNDSSRTTREHLNDDQLAWLRGLPHEITLTAEPGHDVHIFHAAPGNDEGALPLRLTDEEILERLDGAKAECLVFGQVHGPYVRQVGNQTLVCGASAAVNWDGDNRPAYVILEYKGDGNWEAEIHRIAYDFEPQAKKNENSWVPNGERQAVTIRTGEYWNPAHMPH
jgi:predicted phosphodiesterase